MNTENESGPKPVKTINVHTHSLSLSLFLSQQMESDKRDSQNQCK